jgi:cell division protein FtsZ
MRNAMAGIQELRKNVDTLVIIPNERLLEVVGDDVSLVDAFKRADEVLQQGVLGISDVIMGDGLVNLDFADVCTVMRDQGIAHMGIGKASGKNKIENAVKEAINSPLLETSIAGAKGVIVSFTGDASMGLKEINSAAKLVGNELDSDAIFIFGATIDDTLRDEVMVTVIATGLDEAGVAAPASVKLDRTRADRTKPSSDAGPGYEDDEPPEIHEAKQDRNSLKPIREGNSRFSLVNEDITPPFLKDWKKTPR